MSALAVDVERPLAGALAAIKNKVPAEVFSATAVMADRRVTLESDDETLFDDFFVAFGGPGPIRGRIDTPSDIRIELRAHVHRGYGWFRVSGSNDLPLDGHEFSFAVEVEQGTFDRMPASEPGWLNFAFRGTGVVAFAFQDRDCLFSLETHWRRSFIWFLFWRLLRTRPDAIFFHASSLGIFGEGTIFAGRTGGGKSTTSVALAARGHNFLSDEIACYVPATGMLHPYRRPVGIRPGPRAGALNRALPPEAAAKIERDGFVRLEIHKLLAVEPARPFPLRRVVFLRGFADKPSLTRIAPGRAEIVEIQPLMSSFLNESHSRRVFELTRLLSRAKVYALNPGEPDETARYLEEAFAKE